jgi:elongation factor P
LSIGDWRLAIGDWRLAIGDCRVRIVARETFCYDAEFDPMSSIQATRLKRGMLIKMGGGDLFRVLDLQHFTPGNKRGFVQAKLRNIRTATLSDHKFRSEDDVERAMLDERQMQYLYKDGDSFHFMDTTTFEQLHIPSEALGDSVNYIIADAIITVEFYGEEPVGIELPQTVDLKVEDTVPGIKGATASAQVKPARLETGLVVQVPPFVNTGDKIRVNTETGEYLSRV